MQAIRLAFVCLIGCLAIGVSIAQETTPETKNPATTATPQEAPKPTPLHEHPTLVAMWKRNNELRAAVGLKPMALSPVLTQAAQDHAWFMASTGQFSHSANGGMVARVRKYGGTHGSLRENIAWNQQSVAECFQSWQTSPGHWGNIASGEAEVGVGYAIGKNGQTYWVQVFGTP